ncbi:hypothetical protein [Actinoplanes sp. GCM10030250]|uniref:hypothetical protein n=1 Tax=Actinoplanes sp. GCM10030250 TaxID=3273376 RepID=UPI0036098F92
MRRWSAALVSGLMIVAGCGTTAGPAVAADVPCAQVSDQGLSTGAYRGSPLAEGETDCLELPTPAGAKLEIWTPAYSVLEQDLDIDVVDADGTVVCHNWCELTGPAPYRIVVTALKAITAYQLTVQRTDRIDGCTPPQDRTGDTVSEIASFSAERFATCYAIPADRHATSEMLSAAPIGRTGGNLWTAVYDSTGEGICGGYLATFEVVVAHCRLREGQAYSLAVVARPTSGDYRISRKDATTRGADCRTPASTLVGGPASAGSIAAADDIQCYRLSGSETESFWAAVRSNGAVRYTVLDAAGDEVACGVSSPCRMTGSADYRIFLSTTTASTPKDYRLDAWRLGEPGRAPAECPVVTDPARLAPITTMLDDQKTAVCRTVPVRGRTAFQVRVTNTEDGADHPRLYLFDHTGTSNQVAGYCRQDGPWHCSLTAKGDALLVIAPGVPVGRFPFRAEFDCDPGPCAEEPQPVALTSVSPATVPNSGPVTLTLNGARLSAGDTVRLSRAGSAAITAAVTGVSADGTALTARADVTGLAGGAWDVTVTSAAPGGGSAGRVLTVTAAPLKVVRPPSISGTVRVGSTVRVVAGVWSPAASSYAYQWTAGGVAIKGAVGSAYAVPAALRGKRLAVIVTARLANRASTSATSAAATVGYGVAPRATRAPKITGTVKAGKTVKVSVGAWSPGADSYRYEWRLNGKVIKGAGKSSLKIKKSWAGKKLTVVVIAKRAGCYDGRAVAKAMKIKR